MKKIAAGNGAITILGSGFNKPGDVKVDAAGNVYVADSGNGAVKEIMTNGTVVTLAAVFNSPNAIALDASGNIYVADTNLVKVIPVGGGNVITLNYNAPSPMGIAVDALGNIYLSNGYSYITEFPAGGGYYDPQISGFGSANRITTDATGNIYVANTQSGLVRYSIGKSVNVITLDTPFISPSGVAVDASGNVYESDASKTFISKVAPVGGFFIAPSLPVNLNFSNSTGVLSGTANAASAATNYNVKAYNASGGSSATVNIKWSFRRYLL